MINARPTEASSHHTLQVRLVVRCRRFSAHNFFDHGFYLAVNFLPILSIALHRHAGYTSRTSGTATTGNAHTAARTTMNTDFFCADDDGSGVGSDRMPNLTSTFKDCTSTGMSLKWWELVHQGHSYYKSSMAWSHCTTVIAAVLSATCMWIAAKMGFDLPCRPPLPRPSLKRRNDACKLACVWLMQCSCASARIAGCARQWPWIGRRKCTRKLPNLKNINST